MVVDFRAFADRLRSRRVGPSAALVLAETVGSTHVLGQRLLEAYACDSCETPAIDLIAWQQLAGRGRHQRRWASPPGQGIYVSLVRDLPSAKCLQGLPLVVAVVLCRQLRLYLGARCRLKWPNDLMVQERKLGGILIEAKTASERARVVISFGINYGLLNSFAEVGATSLAQELESAVPLASLPSLADLAAELLTAVEGALRRPNDQLLLAQYSRFSAHRPGDSMHCRMTAEEVSGTFVGFDDRGFLRLQVAGKERSISVGEVMGG